MILVNKETLETCDAEDLRGMYRHIMFDFTNSEAVSEVLDGLGMAVLHMPDQPVFDSRYQVVTVGEAIEGEHGYSADWILSPIDLPVNEIAAIKAEEISLSCETAITSGFSSQAIGSLHFYSCDIPAQLNIQANLLAASIGRDVRHICTNANGVREIREHSAEQMVAVGESMGAHIWAQLEKANDLRNAIIEAAAGNDIEALISISW